MKRKYILLSLISVIVIVSVIGVTVAKYTSSIGYVDSTKIAEFHYTVDGLDNTSTGIQLDMLATSKVSDIKYDEDDNITDSGSFVEDAYIVKSYELYNDSEVTVDFDVTLSGEEDDRIFSFITYGSFDTQDDLKWELITDLEWVSDDLGYGDDISKLSMEELHYVINEVNLWCEGIRLKPGQSTSVKLITWCEHDAVYPSTLVSGKADEESTDLSNLKNGIPKDTIILSVRANQAD